MIFENGTEIPLWPSVPPFCKGDQPGIDLPTITPYFPPVWKANRKAVVIFPGGGYGHLAEHEGRGYAEYLAQQGYHCFVVKYRLGEKYHHPAELSDAARGVRMVRAAAGELGLRSDCIGVMGSSAGGHLAATLGTLSDQAAKTEDEGETAAVSSRPDWMILCYPVITADQEFCNVYSFNYLLGADAPEAVRQELSLEKRVSAQTPPAFLWHTMEDGAVPVENSMMFAQALRKAGVPFELHIYQKGPHGRGLFSGHPWAEECVRWMNTF